MAAQLKDPGQMSSVQLVRRKVYDKIAADCSKRSGKPDGLIKFVAQTMAMSKKG